MSRGRTQARRSAMQALYQWLLAGQTPHEIDAQFIAEQDMKGVDLDYFRDLLHGVPREIQALELCFAPFLDRPPQELDPVERSILRMGTYELMHRLDTPYRVVINESVELAKRFGAEGSHKYVNGILDKVAREVRKAEMRQGGGAKRGSGTTERI